MDSARAAISKFTSSGGTHDTNVDETVNPAVTQETVIPTRHEQTQEAIDKETHQDHYHTTVQPLQDRQVLPEQHIHQQAPVEEREFVHGDSSAIQRGVQAEQAQFTSTTQTMNPTLTQSETAAVTGEHIHHHVHETVQPIIHKETVQPEVVHTTIPIHERHQAPSEHHGMSTMPVKNLTEFESSGVPLTGSSHRTEHYEGDPRRYNPAMQVEQHDVDLHPDQHDGMHSHDAEGRGDSTGHSHGHHGHHGHHHGGAAVGTTGNEGLRYGGTTGAQTGQGMTGQGMTGQNYGTSETGGLRGVESGMTGQGMSGQGMTGQNYGTSDYNSGVVGGMTGSGQRGGDEYAGRETAGVTPAHNIATADRSTRDTGAYSQGLPQQSNVGMAEREVSNVTSHQPRDSAHTGEHHHVEGHGIDNQQHHGSALDNKSRDDGQQHGTQPRDPAMVDDKSDKKLTGTGVDGSHSAVFGLTPDGHKHNETSSTTTAPKPAHGGIDENDGMDARKMDNTVAGQMQNPRVAEKGHDGKAEYDGDSSKIGGGAPGGSQGFGEVRPNEHGAESKLKDKMDPTTDSDRDGKRGVMD